MEDLAAVIKALGEIWETVWGKILVLLILIWVLVHKHGETIANYFKSKAEESRKREEKEEQSDDEILDHFKQQADSLTKQLVQQLIERIATLEKALQKKDEVIEELVEHKIECNDKLGRMEERYESLSKRVAGWGRAVDTLRGEAVEKEKKDDSTFSD